MGIPDIIYNNIDLVWIPVTAFVARREHRNKLLIFTVMCLLTLRTQVEMMDDFGHRTGFTPLWQFDAYPRGVLIYSLVITVFLALAHYSPGVRKSVLLAALLSVYIMAFMLSMFIMLI